MLSVEFAMWDQQSKDGNVLFHILWFTAKDVSHQVQHNLKPKLSTIWRECDGRESRRKRNKRKKKKRKRKRMGQGQGQRKRLESSKAYFFLSSLGSRNIISEAPLPAILACDTWLWIICSSSVSDSDITENWEVDGCGDEIGNCAFSSSVVFLQQSQNMKSGSWYIGTKSSLWSHRVKVTRLWMPVESSNFPLNHAENFFFARFHGWWMQKACHRSHHQISWSLAQILTMWVLVKSSLWRLAV